VKAASAGKRGITQNYLQHSDKKENVMADISYQIDLP
jgi:hypothetical protein